jgi:hypothetical protein
VLGTTGWEATAAVVATVASGLALVVTLWGTKVAKDALSLGRRQHVVEAASRFLLDCTHFRADAIPAWKDRASIPDETFDATLVAMHRGIESARVSGALVKMEIPADSISEIVDWMQDSMMMLYLVLIQGAETGPTSPETWDLAANKVREMPTDSDLAVKMRATIAEEPNYPSTIAQSSFDNSFDEFYERLGEIMKREFAALMSSADTPACRAASQRLNRLVRRKKKASYDVDRRL